MTDEHVARGELTAPMQRHVVSAMLQDPQTFARCRSFITPEHFNDTATSDVVAYALNLWDKFKEVPSRAALLDAFSDETHRKIIKRCFDEVGEVRDSAITIERIAKFAKNRAMRLAVREAAAILKYEETGDDSELPRDKRGQLQVRNIEDIFTEASMVGSNVGDAGVFIGDAVDQAIERAKNPTNRELFHTGLKHLDECGVNVERGEIGMVMGRAKGGKSQILLNIAVNNARKGHKVIIYNFEIREDRLEDRLANRIARSTPKNPKAHDNEATQGTLPPLKADASEAEVAAREKLEAERQAEFEHDHQESQLHLETWIETLKKRVNHYGKNLLLKRFLAKKHSMDDVRAHLLLMKAQGWVPDMVILDYVGIVKPIEFTAEVRHNLSALWLDFRSMCQEFNIAGWSASQANRGGAAAEVADMTAVAESFEIIQHIDVGFSVNRTDEEIQKGEGRFFVFASRNDRDNTIIKFTCDFSTSSVTTTSIGTVAKTTDESGKKKWTSNKRKSDDEAAAVAQRTALSNLKERQERLNDARP